MLFFFPHLFLLGLFYSWSISISQRKIKKTTQSSIICYLSPFSSLSTPHHLPTHILRPPSNHPLTTLPIFFLTKNSALDPISKKIHHQHLTSSSLLWPISTQLLPLPRLLPTLPRPRSRQLPATRPSILHKRLSPDSELDIC